MTEISKNILLKKLLEISAAMLCINSLWIIEKMLRNSKNISNFHVKR